MDPTPRRTAALTTPPSYQFRVPTTRFGGFSQLFIRQCQIDPGTNLPSERRNHCRAPATRVNSCGCLGSSQRCLRLPCSSEEVCSWEERRSEALPLPWRGFCEPAALRTAPARQHRIREFRQRAFAGCLLPRGRRAAPTGTSALSHGGWQADGVRPAQALCAAFLSE